MSVGEKTKELWKNPEYREYMISIHKGQKAWNKGIHVQTNSGRTHFKVGQKKTSKWFVAMSKNKGENNSQWKGDKVSYSALHIWVKRVFGKPVKCEKCVNPKGRIEWANKSGNYLRLRSDWMQLCNSCHYKYDRRKKD